MGWIIQKLQDVLPHQDHSRNIKKKRWKNEVKIKVVVDK